MKKKIALLVIAILCVISIGLLLHINAYTTTGNMNAPIDITMEGAAASSEEPDDMPVDTDVVVVDTLNAEEIDTLEETTVASETTVATTKAPETIRPQTQGEWTYAPIPSSAKTYMDYRAITNHSSTQWKLLMTLNFDNDGMIRDNEGYIAAALGSYFGPIGSKWIFLLDNGKEIKIIKADQKQDCHTYNYNRINGYAAKDIIEFVINGAYLTPSYNGYYYNGNFNNCAEYQGKVIAWKQAN